jgi:hypothetical protein
MTYFYRLRIAWGSFKEYGAAVVAAGLLFAGIKQLLGALDYMLPDFVIEFINFIIRTGFRDRMLLGHYGGIPWQFHALIIAEGTISIVLGIFVGLWVNARAHRRVSA